MSSYTVVAVAIGAVCALAYTLYTTLSATRNPIRTRQQSKIRHRNIVCTICQYDLGDDFLHLNCGHAFHQHCALEMIQHGQRSCPNCRESVSSNDLSNIRRSQYFLRNLQMK